jgi:hypothetical protein
MVASSNSLHIRFDFEVLQGKNDLPKTRTGYHVNCVTTQGNEVQSEHKIADALWDSEMGLYVFPIQDKVHKTVRNAFAKMYPNRGIADKAKWTDNGFLFKLKEE